MTRRFMLWMAGLFLLSGAASLVNEVIWFRLLFLELGGTGMSVATVTAAFMGGLGLGAWLFGSRLAQKAHPVTLYGVLEVGIGIYALLVPLLIDAVGRLDTMLLGPEAGGQLAYLIRFLLAGSVLLPPTIAMGGTLPILSRLVARQKTGPGRFVGLLYGLNTVGAVIGAGGAGFLLMPNLGLTATLRLAAGVSIALGLGAMVLARVVPLPAAAAAGEDSTAAEEAGAGVGEARPGLAVLAYACSGLIAFVLQVSWTRILALVFGSSVYAFSLILVIFLAGLGAGGLIGAWLSERVRTARTGLAACLVAAGALALLGQGFYSWLPGFYQSAIVAGGGRLVLGGAAWLAAALMLPSTLLLGAGFPFAVRLATGDGKTHTARRVGWLYAGNAAGGVLGAYLSALVLIPVLGLAGAVSSAGFTALGIGVLLSLWRRQVAGDTGAIPGAMPAATATLTRSSGRAAGAWPVPAAALVAALVWLVIPGWNRDLMSFSVAFWTPRFLHLGIPLESVDPAGFGETLFYRDGITATVAVKREALDKGDVNIFMTVDGKVDASNSDDMPTQVLVGQLPFLAAPGDAKDVMLIGMGSGVTAGAILTHPIASLTVVEIEAEVIAASRYFDDVNGKPLADSRTRMIINDARAYLERTERRFDVVVSEPSSMWLSGPSKLFTREAFELVRSRLEPGGILSQWWQAYDLDESAVLTVLRTLHQVFPHVAVFQAGELRDLLLLASEQPLTFDQDHLAATWAVPAVGANLKVAGMKGPCSTLDALVAEPAAVSQIITPGVLNTDDNALLEYVGPWTVGSALGLEVIARLAADSRGAAAMMVPPAAGIRDAFAARAVGCLADGAMDAANSMAAYSLQLGRTADALWVRGEASRARGDWERALELFDNSLAADPQHAPALFARALALQGTGRYKEALSAWQRVEEVSGASSRLLVNRGKMRLTQGDAAGALADLEAEDAGTEVAGNPGEAAWDLLNRPLLTAMALEMLNRPDEARDHLVQYLAALPPVHHEAPEAVAARHRLGTILSQLPGEEEAGRALLQLAAAQRRQVAILVLDEIDYLLAMRGAEGLLPFYVRDLMLQDPLLEGELLNSVHSPDRAGDDPARIFLDGLNGQPAGS